MRIALSPTALLLALAAAFPALAENEDAWVVPAEQAQCLLQHRDAYLAEATPIAIIPIAKCPQTSLLAGSMEGLQNSGGISNVRTQPDRGKFDTVISYPKSELRCLTAAQIIIKDGQAYLPKKITCDK